MNTRVIRIATVYDADAIAQIEAVAAAHPWTQQAVVDSLSAQSTRAWVCGHPLSAHLLVSIGGPVADILTIAVHPDRQRQGIARHLLAHAHAALAAAGVEELFLEVRRDNTAALGLYTTVHYAQVGERRRYYPDGCDALVLRHAL